MEKISKKLVKKFDHHYFNILTYWTFTIDIEVGGKKVELTLCDTAVDEDHEYYDRLLPLSYLGTDVVLMCSSVDNPNSLENIPERWVPEVRRFYPNVPIILVANKTDLRNDAHNHNELAEMEQKLLRTEDGQAMATRISTYEYLECSAKTNDGVREVVETATRAVLQKSHGPSGKSRNCCKLH
ncbi:hypothetical protein GDO78_002138 [Eleutherodactylus coqui]|uniref:Rho-related GTP-binding protein RhoB n=1 Tax=Eleutherodactylus coqui TaxID=57060 RepID=A0A8J6FV38_ELECQ|nr:hypothetical protein GDO78_002138 [Eleutherodactylus coqui]